MKVWLLIIEDASHLGGPMGTEYTTTIGSKVFKSEDAAKEYAQRQEAGRNKPTWRRYNRELSWDAGHVIYSIKAQEVN